MKVTETIFSDTLYIKPSGISTAKGYQNYNTAGAKCIGTSVNIRSFTCAYFIAVKISLILATANERFKFLPVLYRDFAPYPPEKPFLSKKYTRTNYSLYQSTICSCPWPCPSFFLLWQIPNRTAAKLMRISKGVSQHHGQIQPLSQRLQSPQPQLPVGR